MPEARSNSTSDLDPFWQETEQSISSTVIDHITLSSKPLVCSEAAPKHLKPSTESVFAASGQFHEDFLAKYKEKDPSPPVIAPVIDREALLAKYKEKDPSPSMFPPAVDHEAFLARYSEERSSAPTVPPVVYSEVFLASYSEEAPPRSIFPVAAENEEFLANYQEEDSLSSLGSIAGDPEAYLAKYKEKEEPSPQNAPKFVDREAFLAKHREEDEPSPQNPPVVLDRDAMLANYNEEDEEPSPRVVPKVVLDSADNSKSPEDWAAEVKAFAKRVSDALRLEREERIGCMSEEESVEPSRLDEDDYDD